MTQEQAADSGRSADEEDPGCGGGRGGALLRLMCVKTESEPEQAEGGGSSRREPTSWQTSFRSDWDNWRARNPRAAARGLCLMTVIVLVTAASLIATSLEKLESDEFGVSYDIHAKKLDDAAETEGLHMGTPGFEFIKFKSTFSTILIPEDVPDMEEFSCVSADGLVISGSVQFQYLPDMMFAAQLTKRYRNAYWYKQAVMRAGLSAINHGCGDFNVSSFQSERARVQQRMFEYLKTALEGVNGTDATDVAEVLVTTDAEPRGMMAKAIDVALKNVALPLRYTSAVEAKQSAEEDIALARNQRQQQTTQAGTRLATAQMGAQVIKLQASERAAIQLRAAEFKANATKITLAKEGETYRAVMETLNLTPEGLLSYLGTRALENTAAPELSTVEPATSSYRDEL